MKKNHPSWVRIPPKTQPEYLVGTFFCEFLQRVLQIFPARLCDALFWSFWRPFKIDFWQKKKKKILRKKEENVNLTKKVSRIRTHLKTKLKQFTLLKLLLSIIELLAGLIKREQYKLKMKDCLYKVFFLSQRSLLIICTGFIVQDSKISENH